MRMAIMFANLIVSQSSKPVNEREFKELVEKLMTYLKVNEAPEQVVGPSQAAKIARAK